MTQFCRQFCGECPQCREAFAEVDRECAAYAAIDADRERDALAAAWTPPGDPDDESPDPIPRAALDARGRP